MMAPRFETIVAVAFAHTAEVRAWRVVVSREDGERIERTLRHFVALGHVACFSVRSSGDDSFEGFVGELRSRVGDLTVDVCLAAGESSAAPQPSFLMPVWAFDHLVEGAPAATTRLLGLDLELVATPNLDEEIGAYLPGRAGSWLIHARPLF
jgi:hypothetical protein